MRKLLVLLLALVALALPAGAAAENPCNGNNGKPCRDVPEAPSPLLYPAAGLVVLGGFVLLTHRRRRADG